jgi:thioredoxin-like negative regulator of GroEL
MDTLTIIGIVGGLIALTTAIGVGWRAGQGAVETRHEKAAIPHRLREQGAAITLLQVSSEMCSYCAAMRRILSHIARTTPGIAHREIDVTDEPDIVGALRITQTPTTLLVSPSGDIVTWIRGAAAEPAVRLAIDEAKNRLKEDSHDWTI